MTSSEILKTRIPVQNCYLDGCEFVTKTLSNKVAAVVLQHHLSTTHVNDGTNADNMKSKQEMVVADTGC